MTSHSPRVRERSLSLKLVSYFRCVVVPRVVFRTMVQCSTPNGLSAEVTITWL